MESPVVQLVERLFQNGQSLYLGRNSRGPQFGRTNDNLLALGRTQSGKTSGLIIPSVAVHPGPVVVTSTRSDVIAATIAARRLIAAEHGGSVVEVALGGHASGLAPATNWSATDGCERWNTALDRAFALATTAMPSDQERVWRDFAIDLLSGCLFGAALLGDDDRTMARWIRSADVRSYHNAILEHCEEGHDASFVFAGLLEDAAMAADTRRSVFATVSSQVLGQFRYDSPALEDVFLADDFVNSWGTAYMTIPAERAEAVRPVVTAFVEAITAAWRVSSTRRGTLLLALDEVANVAPLPTLPTIITAGAGDGIQCVLGMQEPGQASRWGGQASVVTAGATNIVIFPGIGNRDYLSGIAELLGSSVQYDLHVEVRTNTPDGARFANHARLIAERMRVERAKGSKPSARLEKVAAMQEARRIAADRMRNGIKNRLDDDGFFGAEAILEELDRYTVARQVPQRRLTVDVEALAKGRGGAFLLNRSASEPREVRPWMLDPLWREVLVSGG